MILNLFPLWKKRVSDHATNYTRNSYFLTAVLRCISLGKEWTVLELMRLPGEISFKYLKAIYPAFFYQYTLDSASVNG